MQQFIDLILSLFFPKVKAKPQPAPEPAKETPIEIKSTEPKSEPSKEETKMQVSANGLKFFEEVEGLRLKPYLDSRGVPTVGIGSTMYEDGRKVTMNDPEITKDRAYELFHNTLKTYEKGVNDVVTVQLTQNQFDALTSFTYNEGVHAFQNSTLLKLINQSKFAEAVGEFNKWERAGNDAHILHGRREKEKALFLS